MSKKKWIVVLGSVIVCLAIVCAVALWLMRPERTVRAFLEAVKNQDTAAVESLISEGITENRKEDIDFFLEDWLGDPTTVYVLDAEHAAWRTKGADKETIPTPRYFAHFYEQNATVAFDEYEDPVVIRVRRETDNTSSILAQLFKPWKVVNIEYQPEVLDDSDVYDEDIEFYMNDEEPVE
ncbi:MAG: hypothetical protein KIH62_004755 [Candidatus Kerfeldbacteria bacterium]|nr:hypothetical protein [Candidatus Kerfeldbacteria bacterium]